MYLEQCAELHFLLTGTEGTNVKLYTILQDRIMTKFGKRFPKLLFLRLKQTQVDIFTSIIIINLSI
jgi:hypothetical protein